MPRQRILTIGVVTVFLILISFGCSKAKPRPGEEGAGSAPGIGAMPVYPHPDGWSAPNIHGVWVNQNTFEACLACHKIKSDKTEASPTCFSCHPLYPHSDGWDKSENHGAYVIQNGRGMCSTQCHGTDLAGGLSGVSCNACHTIYPHPAGWEQDTQHGTYVIDNGLAACKTACHGTDLGGGTSGVSCNACHTIYPHPVGWKQKEQHGTYVTDNGLATCKTACHGTDLGGGNSGVSCDSCHPSYPHTDPNWATGAGHGAYFSSRYNSGSTASVCGKCHGDSIAFVDTKTPSGCDRCHFLHAGTQPSLSDSGAQTKSVLAAQSDCYKCHWSYPHVAYDINGLGAQGWLNPQQPVDHSGFSTAENWGHIYYLMRSPLLVNSSDYRPWGSMGYDDPMLLSAIQYTCGGETSGLCHFDGHVHDGAPTQSPSGTHTPLCAGYCHKPAP